MRDYIHVHSLYEEITHYALVQGSQIPFDNFIFQTSQDNQNRVNISIPDNLVVPLRGRKHELFGMSTPSLKDALYHIMGVRDVA